MNGNFPMKKPLRWIYDEVVKLWLMVDVLGLAGLPLKMERVKIDFYLPGRERSLCCRIV